MKFHDTTFFCDKGNEPTCVMSGGQYYDYIELKDKDARITIYVQDESGLIAFKNAVLHACAVYMEEEHGN
jgi:serine phosphatase RsbU (regulator of sigma subunit)